MSGGLHGVGVSVVNALSEKCFAEVFRDGKKYKQNYATGIAQNAIQETGKTEKTGTRITFFPDQSIFIKQEFDFKIIDERLRELSYLNSGIKITLEEEKNRNKNRTLL